MPRDLLGQIAQARASMLMRGFSSLELLIGPRTRRQLIAEAGEAVIDAGMVLNMPVRELDLAEGWLVAPISGVDAGR